MTGLPVCPTAKPNDDDLTGVITHLAPLTTRRGVIARDPNEPEVRWLLEAGIRAMCEGMLDRSASSAGPVAYSHANGLFDTLPVESVMRCFRDMCAEQGIDPGSANKARLIRRWSFAANYQLDLIAYVFRPALMDHSITEAERAMRAAFPHLTMGEMLDNFANPKSTKSPLDSIFRIQQVLRLMFPNDTTIQEYASTLHDLKTRRWGAFYHEFAQACGLELTRVSPADLAAMMHLITETGLIDATSQARPATLADGTSLFIGTIHLVLESIYGRPWHELAALRPAYNTPVEAGALTPTELPTPEDGTTEPAPAVAS